MAKKYLCNGSQFVIVLGQENVSQKRRYRRSLCDSVCMSVKSSTHVRKRTSMDTISSNLLKVIYSIERGSTQSPSHYFFVNNDIAFVMGEWVERLTRSRLMMLLTSRLKFFSVSRTFSTLVFVLASIHFRS